MDEFILLALLAGAGTALVAGPLGSFIVWRRMAYFGDTMAHSALLGVALGLLLELDLNLTVGLVAVAVALLLLWMQRRWQVGLDSLLGIIAHGSLSLGLVAIAFIEDARIDLMAYLFGDILAVTYADLLLIWGGGLVALLLLWRIWRPLLALTVHEELAQVEGVAVERVRFVFMLLVALVIAVSMKIIGVLLITSLMIIPAASARRFSRTPPQMALLASLMALLAVGLGLAGSLQWDTPTGPSIVVAATLLFIVSRSVPASA
ncbi:zinc ABC transporter permease subunit ZnuB [Magnetovirga frankeli]|uniref:zinc ABC transporter permease subunit ZnuB n=1 Tax=Magnetovirga frankeli TaxID=947516 RepID=UPI0012934EF9|nr:zinc ABC transporter permease subunit ZnuB [gamma proteobacterium SS-5]